MSGESQFIKKREKKDSKSSSPIKQNNNISIKMKGNIGLTLPIIF